jgi:hypothetical protein
MWPAVGAKILTSERAAPERLVEGTAWQRVDQMDCSFA